MAEWPKQSPLSALEFLRMPFRLKNAGMTFQRFMNHTVANISALLRNIDLEPQTQSRMQRKFTEAGIRGKLRNRTEVNNFAH